jgi:holliday junction DNA helicase RuvA
MEYVIIECGGVGYELIVPAKVAAKLQAGQTATMYVHTHFRQDSLELFGFLEAGEKQLFRTLIDVSGVGPKTALGLIDLGVPTLTTAVQQAEVATLAKVPRVGKKLAQKIIIELTPKLGSFKELQLGPLSQQEQDVQAALLALGFDELDISKITPQLDMELPTPVLIKTAIKLLHPSHQT